MLVPVFSRRGCSRTTWLPTIKHLHVQGNITWVPPRLQDSMFPVQVAERVAKWQFWDHSTDKPAAPALWDPKVALPIACYDAFKIPEKGAFECLAYNAVVAGYWWAYASAMASHKEAVPGFAALGQKCIFDLYYFETPAEASFKKA